MTLTDGDRIRGLLGTYCRLVDAGDFAGVGRLFADARLRDEDGTVVATGAAEVEALYAATTRLHEDGTPGTQHVVANTVLEEGSRPDELQATSAYVVFQAVDGLPLQPVVTGSYVDTFARLHGQWRFTDRRFSIGRTGELSHHLTFTPNPGASR